jgi:quinol monooxygenase YgiN
VTDARAIREEEVMLRFIGALKVAPDKVQEVQEAITSYVPHVRDEPGTLEYVVYRNVEDPATIVFYELYRDRDALTAHGSEPLQSMKEVLQQAVVGEPITGIFEVLASK